MEDAIEKLLALMPADITEAERKMVIEAYDLSRNGHADRVRMTGQRFIDHAIAVATTIAELKVDVASTVLSLIHI